MKLSIVLPALLAACGVLGAHPMGNFSINHYALLMPGEHELDVLYVLDLAELPTFQMLQQWDLTKDSPRAALEAKARVQAAAWVKNLTFTNAGAPLRPVLGRMDLAIQDGAGGLSVMRINLHLKVAGKPGAFTYEDHNYPERAGWKEVVIEARAGAIVSDPVPNGVDRSRALTAYPQDPTLAPPQDVSATFKYLVTAPLLTEATPVSKHEAVAAPVANEPAVAPKPAVVSKQVVATPIVATGATPAEANSLGTVKRDDFLSRTLKGSRGPLPIGLALLCLAAAFGVGALHAVEPGHGKTMVAAYLVGSRGTYQQAIFLGGMVTFTHTISVFALGLVTLFLAQYLLPDTLIRVMGVVSGVSIIWIGGLLLYRRARKLIVAPAHTHSHGHSHEHPHAHEHDESRAVAHTHEHNHHHAHSQDHEHAHSHAVAHEHDESRAIAHTHGHNHDHAHSQDHEHAHSHAVAHENPHAHEHDESHAAAHTHGHNHDHAHSQDHGHAHSHAVAHEHPHAHEHDESHAAAHTHGHNHDHAHSQDHEHAHSHAVAHEHPHRNPHSHEHHTHEHDTHDGHEHSAHSHTAGLTHTHDGHTHSHVPEGDVTMGSLIALGISGGLVPCPAALVLLLSCISIGRPALGLLLLVSFSLGLALVLMAIGMMVLVVKKSVPKSNKPSHVAAWARYAPVFSAALIFAIGIYMTGVAMGAFPVVRLIG